MKPGKGQSGFIGMTLMICSATAFASQPQTADVFVNVHGTLTDGACMLELSSARQEIDFSVLSLSGVRKAGDRGNPVPLTLRFKNCLRTQGRSMDRRTGTWAWDALQPIITVGFLAPADSDNPELFALEGTRGIGLRLTDSANNNVYPGQRGVPQFAKPGNNELTWYVIPERTSAPLVHGPFKASVNLFVEYD